MNSPRSRQSVPFMSIPSKAISKEPTSGPRQYGLRYSVLQSKVPSSHKAGTSLSMKASFLSDNWSSSVALLDIIAKVAATR